MTPALKMFCLCGHSEKQLKIRRPKTKRNEPGNNDNQRGESSCHQTQDNSPRFPHMNEQLAPKPFRLRDKEHWT